MPLWLAERPLLVASRSKARQMLGYEPKVAVEEGLERLIHWLREEQLV